MNSVFWTTLILLGSCRFNCYDDGRLCISSKLPAIRVGSSSARGSDLVSPWVVGFPA